MKKLLSLIGSIFIGLFISGCTLHNSVHSTPVYSDFSIKNEDEGRKIAIFFDGTENLPEDHTNISKLYNLVTLQNKPTIFSLYVPGVGTELKRYISGKVIGKGLDERVKIAYRFIAKNYRQNKRDEIYIFGFSRGSYSARVLAGLIYVADLPDFNSFTNIKQELELVDEIYNKYKTSLDYLTKQKRIHNIKNFKTKSKKTRIKIMGLFDTVPALKYDYWEERKIGKLSKEYEDQICNVDKVFHAMSIDDNRAHSFTPAPMKVKDIASECYGVKNNNEKVSNLIANVISEVWFSGAHSDIGGGYDDSNLSGVPANWMIRKIKEYDSYLLPDKAYIPEDIYGISHIGEDSIANGILYQNRNRNLPDYKKYFHEGQNLVIHSSVIKRIAKVPRICREFDFSPVKGDCYSSIPKDINYSKCFVTEEVSKELISNRRSNYLLKFIGNNKKGCFKVDEPLLYN